MTKIIKDEFRNILSSVNSAKDALEGIRKTECMNAINSFIEKAGSVKFRPSGPRAQEYLRESDVKSVRVAALEDESFIVSDGGFDFLIEEVSWNPEYQVTEISGPILGSDETMVIQAIVVDEPERIVQFLLKFSSEDQDAENE